FGRDHPRDGERRQQLAPVCDALDFEPDHGELVDDRRKRRVGVEVLLEPGGGEFHHFVDLSFIPLPGSISRYRRREWPSGLSIDPGWIIVRRTTGNDQLLNPPARVGKSSGRKP